MYKEIFDNHALLLKALSHPKRLEVIHLLRNQELSVGEIQTMLDLPQANLSQHLMVMRKAGVVKIRKQGKSIFYSLAHKNFIQASDLFREILIDTNTNEEISKELLLKMKDLVPLVHDPVCKMRLSPNTAAYTHKHKREEHFFCASGCLSKFKKTPTKYLKKEK